MGDSAGSSSSKGKIFAFVCFGVSVLTSFISIVMIWGWIAKFDLDAQGDDRHLFITIAYLAAVATAKTASDLSYIIFMAGWTIVSLLLVGLGVLQLRGG